MIKILYCSRVNSYICIFNTIKYVITYILYEGELLIEATNHFLVHDCEE